VTPAPDDSREGARGPVEPPAAVLRRRAGATAARRAAAMTPDPAGARRPAPARFRRRPAPDAAITAVEEPAWSLTPRGRRLRRAARSLTLRVVAATLVISAVVVCLAGWFLLRQVADGLEASRERSAVSEASVGISSAAALLAAATTPDAGDRVNDLTQALALRGGADAKPPLYDVVVFASTADQNGALLSRAPRASGSIDPASVPARLRLAVRADPAVSYTVAPLRYSGVARTVPGIVVGGQVQDQGTYEIYYVFPLQEQVTSLGLVEQAVLLAGGLLVLGLCLVAALVTRQVVRPVRAAALAAERYADGDFAQRLEPGGTDDIARLATAFDDMASNLEAQFHRLRELSRVQQRFVADVSHELRTPLTTVRMAADVLYEDRADLPVGLARGAELMQTQLDRFEALLVDLLEISRFDAGAAALDAERLDLAVLVTSAVEDIAPLALRRGCVLRTRLPAGPITAEVDPRRVRRILRNLLANAIDHSEGQPIEVTLAGDRLTAAIVVRDRGVGLRPEDAEQVFDRFWRADPARARTTGGTGLGLSIAREDAHLHGGEVDAWGAIGHGAAFRVLLPRSGRGPLLSEPLPLVPADTLASASALAATAAVATGTAPATAPAASAATAATTAPAASPATAATTAPATPASHAPADDPADDLADDPVRAPGHGSAGPGVGPAGGQAGDQQAGPERDRGRTPPLVAGRRR